MVVADRAGHIVCVPLPGEPFKRRTAPNGRGCRIKCRRIFGVSGPRGSDQEKEELTMSTNSVARRLQRFALAAIAAIGLGTAALSSTPASAHPVVAVPAPAYRPFHPVHYHP